LSPTLEQKEAPMAAFLKIATHGVDADVLRVRAYAWAEVIARALPSGRPTQGAHWLVGPDGKLVRHWDVVPPEPAGQLSG
jgi:hypothetical protein